MTDVATRVRIEGRVQGVWFRAWTVEEARARGLRGWVRNRRDGCVEAVFAGPEDRVEEMIGARRRGSRASEVTGVHRHKAAEEHLEMIQGEGFRQLGTA